MKGRVVCFDLDQLMALLDEMCAAEFGQMLATGLIEFHDSGEPVSPPLDVMFRRQRRRTVFAVARHLRRFGVYDHEVCLGEVAGLYACDLSLFHRIVGELRARGRLVKRDHRLEPA